MVVVITIRKFMKPTSAIIVEKTFQNQEYERHTTRAPIHSIKCCMVVEYTIASTVNGKILILKNHRVDCITGSAHIHVRNCDNSTDFYIREVIKVPLARRAEQRLKSISVFVPLERVQASLSEIGFLLQDTATVVADGKFWQKMLYVRGQETISVSEEIGDVYPKDPIITICGSNKTISHVVKGVGG